MSPLPGLMLATPGTKTYETIHLICPCNLPTMIDDGFRLMPEQASTHAPQVDLLYFFLLGMTVFFTVLVAALILYFSIKYRKGNVRADRTAIRNNALVLEVAWTVVPLLISMGIFGWGATLFFDG